MGALGAISTPSTDRYSLDPNQNLVPEGFAGPKAHGHSHENQRGSGTRPTACLRARGSETGGAQLYFRPAWLSISSNCPRVRISIAWATSFPSLS